MNSKFVSKLKQPSKLAPSTSQEKLTSSSPKKHATNFRRRSKSLTSLASATSTKPESLLKRAVNATMQKKCTVFASKAGVRRSNTFLDLPNKKVNTLLSGSTRAGRPTNQPVAKKALPKPPIATATNQRNAKRPPTTNISESSKPKISKPAPYDYKARYGLLLEKHTKCVHDKKELQLEVENLREFNAKHLEVQANLQRELEAQNQIIKEQNELKVILEKRNIEYEQISRQLSDANTTIAAQNQNVESLKDTLNQNYEKIRVLHNQIQDLKGNIRVFCRLRPSIADETHKSLTNINVVDENIMEIKKAKESCLNMCGKAVDLKQEFSFDRVFCEKSTQEDIFAELSQLVQSALDGYNVCVFAYGQTGSGKTYTMQGNDSNLGMIPKTINLLFSLIGQLERMGWKYVVKASFIEIYNENIRDLLNVDSKEAHEIKYNAGKGVTVTNLSTRVIESEKALKNVMEKAQKKRAVAKTNFNLHSSRSHAITKIILEGIHENTNNVFTGSMNLVDLAGSESAKNSQSERLEETKNINKSLSTLQSVMLALHNQDQHVPYRNSKLTYLLQSCLGGNSKTLMIVNISPFEENYNETINSLRFAAKVKEVKLGCKRQKTLIK